MNKRFIADRERLEDPTYFYFHIHSRCTTANDGEYISVNYHVESQKAFDELICSYNNIVFFSLLLLLVNELRVVNANVFYVECNV